MACLESSSRGSLVDSHFFNGNLRDYQGRAWTGSFTVLASHSRAAKSERDGCGHRDRPRRPEPSGVLGDGGEIRLVEQVVGHDRELRRAQQIVQRLAGKADIGVHQPVGVRVPVRRQAYAPRRCVLGAQSPPPMGPLRSSETTQSRSGTPVTSVPATMPWLASTSGSPVPRYSESLNVKAV